MKMTLTIVNTQEVTGSVRPSHTFTPLGGVIGSGEGVDWRVQDMSRSIPDVALKVGMADGAFFIAPATDVDVFVNGARAPIREGSRVRMGNRHSVMIGGLQFAATLPNDHLEFFTEDGRSTIDTLMAASTEDGDSLLDDGASGRRGAFSIFEEERRADMAPDPVAGITAKTYAHRDADPVALLGQFEEPDEDPILGIGLTEARAQASAATQSDHTMRANASIQLHSIRGEAAGHSEFSMQSAKSYNFDDHDQPGNEVDHVALRPLAHALGLPISGISQDDAHRLLGEVGAALRAVAEEINALYTERRGHAHRFPLVAMHMHAIEDNPLRFKTSAESALQALLLGEGPVYLNAPAAFRETLQHLNHHQSATESAVDSGLDALLKALSPEALERRFRNYARKMPSSEEQDAWCWRMYRHYFDELRSNNQRGLQMLFWEVFGHEYQNAMRNLEWNQAEKPGRVDAVEEFE